MAEFSISLSQNLQNIWNSKLSNTMQYMIPQRGRILDSDWWEVVDSFLFFKIFF